MKFISARWLDGSCLACITWVSSLVQSKNGVWCKSRLYCCHISRYLVKTTLRILGQQIREEKNMSSYFVDALLSKYTAASSFFPNAERSTCSIGTSGVDYGSSRASAAIASASSLSGVYSLSDAVYHSCPIFTPGNSPGQDALDCSLFDRSRLIDSCYQKEPGPFTTPPDKQHHLYPWMRVSGMCCFLYGFILNPLVVRLIPWSFWRCKNRKTFIAQLMSFAAINSFVQRSCAWNGQRPCRWAFSLHSYYSYCLLLSFVVVKKGPASCVNQLSCILQILSDRVCTAETSLKLVCAHCWFNVQQC